MTTQFPRRAFLVGSLAVVLAGCTATPEQPRPTTTLPSPHGAAPVGDELRPLFHYSAASNQINDPNGLLWYDGEYHLFYQYNVQGAVHWGHAISTDLLHWERMKPALYPDQIGQIWSGSAVVDERNTAGFQSGKDPAFVALFTYSSHDAGTQSQGLAYSNDRGRTWNKYSANPVIPNTGQRDFRDPKVFWHEPTGRWVMVLSAGDHVEFYASTNLREWDRIGEFGHNQGAHGGSWECPDLFPITVQHTDETRWVLSVSVFDGAPAGGSGMQYFLGDFDGTTFHNQNPPATTLWQNFGPDFYAGVTWGDAPFPDDRRLMIAWLDNWKYRDIVPTQGFNGQLALVRELRLEEYPEGERLTQAPVTEYQQLRTPVLSKSSFSVRNGEHILEEVSGSALELQLTFDVGSASAAEFGVNVRQGDGQRTAVGYDLRRGEMYVDRGNSGTVPVRDGRPIDDRWARRYAAPLAAEDGLVRLRLFVDRSSVEVVGNDKEQISCLILPGPRSLGVSLYANEGSARLVELHAYALGTIY